MTEPGTSPFRRPKIMHGYPMDDEEREAVQRVLSKHDPDCLRRKDEMKTPYLCTCDMTDQQVTEARAGEPYGQMVHMRTAVLRVLDTFDGQTISDRALEAVGQVERMRNALIVIDRALAAWDPDINAGRGPESVRGLRALIDDALGQEFIR